MMELEQEFCNWPALSYLKAGVGIPPFRSFSHRFVASYPAVHFLSFPSDVQGYNFYPESV